MILSDEELMKLNRGLVRYARSLLRDCGLQRLKFNEEDLAMQAIIVFLDKPTIYDSSRGSLLVFLKKVLKNSFLNEIRSANVFTKIQGKIVAQTPIGINATIDGEIDHERLVSSIGKELETDPVAYKILLSIAEGFEKTDICEKFGYDDNKYYNGIRRIRTAYFKVRPYEKRKFYERETKP